MSAPGRLIPSSAAALVLIAGCSGSPDRASKSPPGDAPPMRLVAYHSCDELLDGLRTTTAKQVGPYGLGGGFMEDRAITALGGDAKAAAPVPGEAGGGAADGAPDHSGTNAHEAGADEPDMVKTDGRRIVVLAQNTLQVIDPATKKIVHRLKLPNTFGWAGQLLVSGDRALVFSGGSQVYPGRRLIDGPDGPAGGRMTILLVDLTGPPKIINSMTSDAGFVDARQTGSVARIVVRSVPRIEFPQPRQSGSGTTERNRQIVRNAPIEAWLPTFAVHDGDSVNGGHQYKVPCERVSRPADNPGSSMISVLTVDLAKGLGDPETVSVATEGQTVYGNGANLYVTGTRWSGGAMDPMAKPRPFTEERTEVHQFDTTGSGRPRYVASGAVPGNLLNQYSMSEHGGHLRLATTTGAPNNRSQSSIHVLQRRGAKLESVGRVDGLGKGERIYAVRFLGSLGYVVTFRQVDPLYVVDLNNPASPRVTGELKITGYSAYLHPMADGRLLGVGQEATKDGRTTGTQVSLFDVKGAPRKVGAFRLPDASSAAEFDPHAFLYWPKSGLTVIPVTSKSGIGEAKALVLTVGAEGIRELGSVEHPSSGNYTPIQRSLIVGDTLWTVSEGGARASDAKSLADQGWLGFQTT